MERFSFKHFMKLIDSLRMHPFVRIKKCFVAFMGRKVEYNSLDHSYRITRLTAYSWTLQCIGTRKQMRTMQQPTIDLSFTYAWKNVFVWLDCYYRKQSKKKKVAFCQNSHFFLILSNYYIRYMYYAFVQYYIILYTRSRVK